MLTVLRLSGIAIIALFSSMLLRERYKLSAILAALGAFILIFSFSMGQGVSATVETVKSFTEGTGYSEYAVIMLKALGIAYISSVTETVCREAGEGMLASAAEFSGKVEIIALSLPLISSVLDIATELL